MSWLISLLIAGAMFSSENKLHFQANNYTETKNVSVVKAEETERFEQTYPLTANGRVSLSNVNGSITIEGWDKSEVKLEYVKTAEMKERLADVQVKIDAQSNSLSIEADYNSRQNRGNGNSGNRNNGVSVEFHLMVPRNAVLNEIETVNGSVNLSNTTNLAKVSTVNGEVKASNLRGTAELSTVNGTVTADFEQLDNTSRISLETVNGRAFLTLPSDTNATVRAETTNGQIMNDFGLPVRRQRYGGNNSLYGKIGTGNVKIKLESVNGELSLRRRQDGKTSNPVTNLLESKSDDDDFDDAINESVNNALRKASRVKVEIPEVNIEVEKAMAEAQKEIAKEKININSAEMQKTIRNAMKQQKEAMESMRDAGWFGGAPSVERKSESFAVKGIPKVTINAKDCAVFVRGWEKPEVQYTVTQISRNNNRLPVQFKADHSDSEVNIVIDEKNLPPGNDWDGSMRLRVEVFVPRKSDLKIITDHAVRLENISGKLDVQGGDESVDVRDSGGDLNIAAADGKVRVIGFQGTVDAKTGDGLISLEGNFQKLSARTADGTIILTLPENANATIESNNKDINAEGIALVRQNDGNAASRWKLGNGGETYSLFTADGKIFVRTPNSIKTK